MKEKLLAQTPVGEDKDYLGAWTTGDKNPTTLTETCRRATAQSLIDDKAYARGREPVEVDLNSGGSIGYVPD